MKKLDFSIVTACDANYLWGVFLVTASIQKTGLPVNLIVYQAGFDAAAERYITQFPVAELRKDDSDNPYSINNRKPGYLLQADSEYVAWFDADCFVSDDITHLLIPLNEQFQVRLRADAENASVYDHYYRPGDKRGEVPSWILDQWRSDVGGRKTPRARTSCLTNCFVIHHRFMPFIEEWGELIRRVVNPKIQGLVDRDNPAYWMTDESAMSAILLFSEKCPDISPYRLDDLSTGHIIHFSGGPKPWVGWNKRFLYCIPKVIELLEWLEKQGFKVPPVPSSFKRWRIPYSYAEAHCRGMYRDLKSRVGRRVRSFQTLTTKT